jgi:hypothetical protein
MPARQSIHVFQCGDGSPYALTRDRNGSNLPEAECPAGWVYFTTLDAEPFELPRVAVDARKVHDDIAAQGYSLAPWLVAPG